MIGSTLSSIHHYIPLLRKGTRIIKDKKKIKYKPEIYTHIYILQLTTFPYKSNNKFVLL